MRRIASSFFASLLVHFMKHAGWVTMPRGMDDDLSHDINSKSPELNATRRGVEELNRR
jgi:hypothetical protein